MQYYFRVYQICSDMDLFKSTMDMSTKLMGHMATGFIVDIGEIDLTLS